MSRNNAFADGNDVESALEIIDAEGGVGEWESAEAAEPVERWLFPRFPGADLLGTCSDAATKHKGQHAKTDKCVEFEPDPGNNYLSRTGIGPYDTDVETVAGWLDAPRNLVGAVLMLGEPGTGKTALVEAAVTHAERTLTTVVCTPDHTKDSLFLRFMGEGKGDCIIDSHNHGENHDDYTAECERSPYTLGPIPHAAKFGHTLYADEFMLLVDGLKPVFYSLADGRRFLPEGNVNGSPLEIDEDFRLVLSSNPLVRGASLPEPMASRCASTTLTVETDGDMLRDLGIDESVVAAWEALGQQGLFRPQIRELRLADHWLSLGNPDQAVSAFLPEHCPESERKAVRDQVLGFLGGSVRDDGRLVVR